MRFLRSLIGLFAVLLVTALGAGAMAGVPASATSVRAVAQDGVLAARAHPCAPEAATSETLGTTEEHPFYVHGKGWVEAADLTASDLVVSHAS